METDRLADEEIGCTAAFLLNGMINDSSLVESQNRTDHESWKRESDHSGTDMVKNIQNCSYAYRLFSVKQGFDRRKYSLRIG